MFLWNHSCMANCRLLLKIKNVSRALKDYHKPDVSCVLEAFLFPQCLLYKNSFIFCWLDSITIFQKLDLTWNWSKCPTRRGQYPESFCSFAENFYFSETKTPPPNTQRKKKNTADMSIHFFPHVRVVPKHTLSLFHTLFTIVFTDCRYDGEIVSLKSNKDTREECEESLNHQLTETLWHSLWCSYWNQDLRWTLTEHSFQNKWWKRWMLIRFEYLLP